jgi:acetylornithine deacetylase/succinyl-diaminopimelate desuccinylase-like protein
MSIERAIESISRERAAELTLELVRIPSPTGDTVDVSRRLASALQSLGMEVTWFDRLPETPVVIGRLAGAPGGKTLILNGHLDTVPIPHPEPERRDGRVYGRGSIDMKGCIVAAVEAVRALQESETQLAGDVVICAHGLHEAPGGHAEDLIAAIREGAVTGDAAIVLEVGHDALPIAGLGSGITTARFSRPGSVTHELMTVAGTPHPAFAVAEAVLALQELEERLKQVHVPGIGPESFHIGQVHCGDFFNRFPNVGWIEGLRRYGPENTAEFAEGELRALLSPIAEKHGLDFEMTFEKVRDGFRIAPDHPLVRSLQQAYSDETGRELPITGIRIIADAPVFDKVGGIPCLYHGLAGEGAHGDLESVPESELERAARVYLRTAVNYLGLANDA